MKIMGVVGARPNFMKISPIVEEMKKHPWFKFTLLHTGQHYDTDMSDTFFRDLDLPNPDIFLNVGSGSHAEQTAKVMLKFEAALKKNKPDLLIVVGDVNSTIACSLVAVKMGVKIAHVEAGLRSFDRGMPEEINRIITDAISDLLFTTCKDANRNLQKEGIPKDKIHFVGNVMIDTMLRLKSRAHKTGYFEKFLNLEKGGFSLLTLHRPRNVDVKENLTDILLALYEVQERIRIVWPLHPRTESMLKRHDVFGKLKGMKNMKVTRPLSYLQFLNLMMHSKFVMTDSGGIQEETTVLKIPCLTLRDNTERPVTISQGTNVLVKSNASELVKEVDKILSGNVKKGRIPRNWDGKASTRIVKVLSSFDSR